MKITWLGQAGLLFEKGNFRIMIDPYLSDSVAKVNPANYRRVPVLQSLFDTIPDVMIFTHNHLDHYDPETAERFLNTDKNITVLAPGSVWQEVRKSEKNNNYVLFNRHTRWTQNGIVFTAVMAAHSDNTPIGVIIDDLGKKYYITGDTLYNSEIFSDIPEDIYALFLPVNGTGNNMNMQDAKAFCERINPKYAIPLHCGLFDEIDMNLFEYKNKVIPDIYKEIKLV